MGNEPGIATSQRRTRAADISLVAAGSFMTTGLILSLLHRSRADLQVGAATDGHSARLELMGRF